jgi:hypothetical protein
MNIVAASFAEGAPESDVPTDAPLLHATTTIANRAHFLTSVSKPV